ncbi:winged helix-turn-helix domain-containing protein [Actinoplanes oblitus]|uniref:Winged helix-turn-helix domain-containing protein n=1 Tax=Actinoplanes oblitus TaxID=3040509 RepID=A0ABY8WT46_9ACTN|nr:BTAD domain-containing putative transcriptional regulator [Actinoplanes oblitus]WIN00623.1 winged helix-turn-helix domain-containing protein [Actinoplanes oblitus]
MTDALRFEVLGPIRAYRGDEPIDLGPPSRRAVLAILLLHAGRPVPMERIVAALWDGDPPENGVDVVLRCIGALRRTLDPERTSLLTLTDGGYVLRVGDSAVDAGRFRAGLAQARREQQTGNADTATLVVHRALGLWQDKPLTGMTGTIFEAARTRLNEERAEAARLLATPSSAEQAATAPAVPMPAAAETAVPMPAPTAPAVSAPAPAETAVSAPVPAAPAAAKPEYPEPIDPWDGHDLFPPDPMSIL